MSAPHFLLRTAIFALPIFIGIFFLERRLGDIPNSYNTKLAHIEKQKDSIELLILGSSQALYGIDPAGFSVRAFNMANSSQPVYYDKEIALRLAERLPRLKYVILPVSYFSCYYKLEDSPEHWRVYYYKRFWGIPLRYPDGPDIKEYSYLALYTPATVLDFLSKGFRVDLSGGIDANGFERKDSAGHMRNISEQAGRERVAYHNSLYREKNYDEVTVDLEELISAMSARNVQVILVDMPVYRTYSKYCREDILQKNGRILARLSGKYHCRYLSYRNDLRFTADDFFDNDHLSFAGAGKFSRILNRDLFETNPLPADQLCSL